MHSPAMPSSRMTFSRFSGSITANRSSSRARVRPTCRPSRIRSQPPSSVAWMPRMARSRMDAGRLASHNSRGSLTCESAEIIPNDDALDIGSPIEERIGTRRYCSGGDPEGVGLRYPGPGTTHGRPGPLRRRVDHPQLGPLQVRLDVLDGLAVEDLVGTAGDIADVGREHGVGEGPERVVGGQRLDVEDVEAGPGDPSLRQRLDEGGLVDKRPS